MKLLLAFFVSFVLALSYAKVKNNGKAQVASVTFVDGEFVINKGQVQDSISVGEFTDEITETGWSFLSVETDEKVADMAQAYAAGLVEGHLTRQRLAQHWNNTLAGYCNPISPSAYCLRLKQYIETNFNDYIQDMIKQFVVVDPYWHQVQLFLYQLSGLVDGYNGQPGKPRTTVEPFGLLLAQINGDLEDLEVALKKPEELRRHVLGSGSCSALVKLLPGNKELYISQDTWSDYQSMLRIMKTYKLNFHLTEGSGVVIPGRSMSFSSYPGSLYSGDDYYTIHSSGLVSMETTIGNSNSSLIQYIQPIGTVLEGIRNQVANRLANSGNSWAQIFSRFNSGTYNNEWMILDYNKFTPGQPLPANTLTVLEQIPGFVVYDDVTNVLSKQMYWPSYNSPYFPKIYNMSNIQPMVEKFGDWFTYENTPRAKIFRRDHKKVNDIPSMIKLMRYNDFKHDELSRCNCTPPYSGENAISARSDLNPKNGTYPFGALGHRDHGGTDMKLTSYAHFKKGQMFAVCGPTHDTQPPFSWSTADFADVTPHEGHPDLFDFKPILIDLV